MRWERGRNGWVLRREAVEGCNREDGGKREEKIVGLFKLMKS